MWLGVACDGARMSKAHLATCPGAGGAGSTCAPCRLAAPIRVLVAREEERILLAVGCEETRLTRDEARTFLGRLQAVLCDAEWVG